MAVEILESWKKKVPKKVLFSLMARPFTPPPPLLMARPLREELFFAASLSNTYFNLGSEMMNRQTNGNTDSYSDLYYMRNNDYTSERGI